jgi:phosphate transport system permease protein
MMSIPTMPSDSPMSIGKARSIVWRVWRERAIVTGLVLCAVFTIAITSAIIVVLFRESFRFFAMEEVTFWQFISEGQWSPLLGVQKHWGIWPLIFGTLVITTVAMAVALPLGLTTAIYLSEYAPAKVRAVFKPVLEVLAGIPTVVFGFFALTMITPALQWIHEGFSVYNAMSAGLAVGVMCLPVVTSLSEDALRAVPDSLRQGAYGMGATRFEVAIKVVTPAALSGIIAAFLLATARAIGETMIVALAAGAAPPNLAENFLGCLDPRHETQPMTGYLVQIFLGDASNFGIEYLSSYAVAATLFVMTFGLTVIGHRVRVRFRQEYE